MSNTLTTLAAIVKELYPSDALGNTLLEGSALYNELPKDWAATGDPIRMATVYASGAGSASTFADAQATIGSVASAKWALTTADEYSLFRVANKTIRAAKGNRGALVDALQFAGDHAQMRLKRNMHRALYRDSGGSLAQIASGSGTTTITLTQPEDIVHFSVGDVLESSSTDGLSGSGDGEYITITEVDEDLGTITKAGGNWNAGGNYAVNDHLFMRGTFGLKLSGLASWLPAAAPGATPFFGVARNVSTKLSGIRFEATAALHQTIEGALIGASTRAQRSGAKPTHVFTNPAHVGQLVRELGDRTRYEPNAKGHIGFDAIILATPSGPVKVMIDLDCPYGVAYMLDIKTFKLFGYGEPGWIKDDGNEILRQSDGDAIEGRMGCYWQLGCKAPGHNVRIDLDEVIVD